MAYAEPTDGETPGWRARFKRPDGTWGSRSGFNTAKAAENWGDEQETLIRRNLWLDPRDAEMEFGKFAEEHLDAVASRLEPTTVAKYRSFLDNHLLPQWESWPLAGIFNSYVEIEKWLSELHEEYEDSSVASIFALFSTFMSAAVKARKIPANPCAGVRVTSGEFEIERLVATPVQALRGAMRLYESGLGLGGFTLGLLDFYAGGRWGELVGQQRHEYDAEARAIQIREPLKEVGGHLYKGGRRIDAASLAELGPRPTRPVTPRRGKARKKGRTKTPAGTRLVELPPSIAVFYEELMDSHRHPFVLCSAEGAPLRRSNFRNRYWRPVWDGTESGEMVPPIVPGLTFHEGRHSHATWLTEDGIPEVARRARLGQKMKGMARVYDHVTPEMRRQVIQALEARWWSSVAALLPSERARLGEWFPHLRGTRRALPGRTVLKAVPISSPFND